MQTVKFATSDLKKVLKRLSQVVPTKGILTVLESVVFSITPSGATIKASNIENTLTIPLPCITMDSFIFLPDYKTIKDILDNLPDMEISITYSDPEGARTITLDAAKYGKFNIAGDNLAEFPAKTQMHINKSFVVTKDNLEKIRTASYFVSTDTLRPAMTGVLFEVEDEKIRFVSTDAHSLYMSEDLPATGANTESVVVSSSTIDTLLSLDPNKDVTVTIDASHVRFTNDSFELQGRLIDAKFPPYRSIIPTYTGCLKLSTDELIKTVKILCITANKTNRQITLDVAENGLRLQSEDLDFNRSGTVDLQIKENKMVPAFKFALNGKKFNDLLSCFEKKDVTIQTDGSPTRAFVFRGDENQDLFLLMPLMVGA